jgi:hypothetical protein
MRESPTWAMCQRVPRSTSADSVVAMPALFARACRMRDEPAVERAENAIDRLLDAPGVGRCVVVIQQTAHRELGSLAALGVTAHAIGQRQQHALGVECFTGRCDGACKVLVARAQTGDRALSDGYFQCHRVTVASDARRGQMCGTPGRAPACLDPGQPDQCQHGQQREHDEAGLVTAGHLARIAQR